MLTHFFANSGVFLRIRRFFKNKKTQNLSKCYSCTCHKPQLYSSLRYNHICHSSAGMVYGVPD